MRDLVLREALETMAADAALCLRELVAAGDEIPYEVRESGDGSPLAEYTPQTARFIRDRLSVLAEQDSFGAACSALDAAGLAGLYLDEMGVPAPADARRRAELAGILFLCRLWRGSTDFTLDDARLDAAIDELLALAEAGAGEIEIIVPLRGFQMDVERLALATVTIVRSDVVDVPAEARVGEGMGGAAWQPTFLAFARIDALAGDEAADLGVRSVEAFKRLITTLRLFKAGGVALGPHAWIRPGGDRWRRISTGAGKPRPGGYRLADGELADMAGFARALAGPSTPFARAGGARSGFPALLARSLSRFEAGVERANVLDSLNDHLLSLRFLLEGDGPASLGLPMRIAALCAEPSERADVKAIVDQALRLERELWSGEPAPRRGDLSPADVAAAVEDLARAILSDACCGHLGSDLRTTADEILLADGLAVGEGSAVQRGETAEWQMGETLEAELDAAVPVREAPEDREPEWGEVEADELEWDGYFPPEAVPEGEGTPRPEEVPETVEVPEPPSRITVEKVNPRHDRGFSRAQNLIHEVELADAPDEAERETFEAAARREPARPEPPAPDDVEPDPAAPERRLYAVPEESPVNRLLADSDAHRRDVADRVSFLFPRPETCEWQVPEVGYDRRRRADVDDPVTHAS